MFMPIYIYKYITHTLTHRRMIENEYSTMDGAGTE